jgi:hypothetical protein
VLHDVERLSEHALIVAEQIHLRHRNVACEGAHHGEFSIDRVGGGEQLPRRLLAQHIVACRRADTVGRVGLAALELPHFDLCVEAGQLAAQEARERSLVEAMVRRNRDWRSRGRSPGQP